MTSVLHEELLSDPAAIGAVRKRVEDFAAQHGFGDAAVGDIGLCLNEAITNIIRHAYAGKIDRPIVIDAGFESATGLSIALRDWGNGRMPDLQRPPADPAALKPGGLGLPCLKQLLDGLEFVPQPDGMLLKMVRRRR